MGIRKNKKTLHADVLKITQGECMAFKKCVSSYGTSYNWKAS